jgi:hypothetical protein
MRLKFGDKRPSTLDTTCIHCGKRLDQHSDFEGGIPKHGDASLCIGCGQLSIYDLYEKCLRLPTDTERYELEQDPKVRRFKAAWRFVVRKTPH